MKKSRKIVAVALLALWIMGILYNWEHLGIAKIHYRLKFGFKERKPTDKRPVFQELNKMPLSDTVFKTKMDESERHNEGNAFEVGADNADEIDKAGVKNVDNIYKDHATNVDDVNREAFLQNLLLKPPIDPGEQLRYKLVGPIFYRDLNIVYCGITKTAHSQFRALFCHALTSDIDNKIANDPFRVHGNKNCSSHEDNYMKKRQEEKLEMSETGRATFLATVRDPIERFVSAYIDKCIKENNKCYNCKRNDINCFVHKTWKTMGDLAHRRTKYGSYLKHINHFYPQYWCCDFQAELEKYELFHYNTTRQFRAHVRERLLQLGVPKRSILEGWGDNRTLPFLEVSTSHVSSANTVKRLTEEIMTNIYILNELFEVYFVDYHYLSLPLPPEMEVLCSTLDHPARFSVCKYIKLEHG